MVVERIDFIAPITAILNRKINHALTHPRQFLPDHPGYRGYSGETTGGGGAQDDGSSRSCRRVERREGARAYVIGAGTLARFARSQSRKGRTPRVRRSAPAPLGAPFSYREGVISRCPSGAVSLEGCEARLETDRGEAAEQTAGGRRVGLYDIVNSPMSVEAPPPTRTSRRPCATITAPCSPGCPGS